MNKRFDWKNIKKTDWIVLALIGVILLVIVMPEDNGRGVGGSVSLNGAENIESIGNSETIGSSSNDKEVHEAQIYSAYLEERLEAVLREMEGVGKVKVMITLSDYGQSVVEKDSIDVSNTITETDSNGGSRDTFSRELTLETVQIENESGTYPYVGMELLPTIEGIVVVAEGGGNAMVISQISKAAMALFPIEAHKIIVVKMSQGG